MAHWKKYMDKDFLGAFDLEGRDVTLTISHVSGGEITGEGGKKNKKPVAHIEGRQKKLALNATNCKVLEQLAGSADVEKWRGLRVTIFPTTTQFGGREVECIRIRPYHPKESGPKGNGRDRGGSARSQNPGSWNDTQRSMKERGVIDETDKERLDRIEADFAKEVERNKALAERVLGRTLNTGDKITEDEARLLREAFAAESDVPSGDEGTNA